MLKYGFFDSVKGDRKYNSKDVAELFDGIIVDGIYGQLYERFSVDPKRVIETEEDKMTVTVGSGQAWLSHTKILNTSKLELVISESIGADRYDAIIVEVNDNLRNANIFVKPNVKTKTDDPATRFDLQPGQLVNTEFIHQYLLAVIYVEGGSTRITAENIASKIGFAIPDGIPYVTCPLDPFPADETLKQWVAQWYKFLTDSDDTFTAAQNDRNTIFNMFMSDSDDTFTAAQNDRNTDYKALRTSIVEWLNSTETDWDTWYNSVKNDFEGYVDNKVEVLSNKINNLTTRLNALADSDDPSLDQLSEIVSFIKTNKALIDSITETGMVGLNTKGEPGYVAAGIGNSNMFWGTDGDGNPGWRSPKYISTTTVSSFAAAYADFYTSTNYLKFYIVHYAGADSGAPITTSSSDWWWNVIMFGANSRVTAIALCPYRYRNHLFFEQDHDSNVFGWYDLHDYPLFITQQLSGTLKELTLSLRSDSNIGLICFKRSNVYGVFLIDMWTADGYWLIDSISSHLTITKTAGSRDINIVYDGSAGALPFIAIGINSI